MPALRTLITAAFLTTAVATSSASAGPHCPIITDPRGDAGLWGTSGAASSRALDVLEADVASADERQLRIDIRVDQLAGDPATAGGKQYLVWFDIPARRGAAKRFMLMATASVGGEEFHAYISDGDLRAGQQADAGTLSHLDRIDGMFDEDRSLIRLIALFGVLRQGVPRFAAGVSLTNIRVQSRYTVAATTSRVEAAPQRPWVSSSDNADDASTTTAHRVGSPDCPQLA